MQGAPAKNSAKNNAGEVAVAFLRLGVTSFGGPAAHLGYFREEFVRRRAWLDEQAYAGVVGLCQILPGPASSQAAMLLGYMRAGPAGALAAWVAFTAPSALLMILFARALLSHAAAFNGPLAVAVVHGLKLVAVPVVAQAVCLMARALCPDARRAAIAALAAGAMIAAPGGMVQLIVIAAGAAAGAVLLPAQAAVVPAAPRVVPARAGAALIAAFLALFLLLPAIRGMSPLAALAEAMYRAGALVFGGGHVVLPLLRESIVASGWLSDETFLAGYGAAQALPGPLFSVAAFIGMLAQQPAAGWPGAAIALAMIFLPGALILFGVMPFWSRLQANARAQGALKGVNAAVVGVLAAALYAPVGVTAITRWTDAAIAVAAFGVLMIWRVPSWAVVLGTVAAACAAVLA